MQITAKFTIQNTANLLFQTLQIDTEVNIVPRHTSITELRAVRIVQPQNSMD
jgi:hypothetical protein